MKKNELGKHKYLIAAILFNLLLMVAVVGLMRHVRNLLDSDVKVNLTQIVTQNKDVIASRLKVVVNNLEMTSDKMTVMLEEQDSCADEEIRNAVSRYVEKDGQSQLYAANKDGACIHLGNEQIDVAGRNYFRLAMQGISNISEDILSRMDGNEIYVVSVPLYFKGEIIGTLQQSYSHDEMYELCSIPLFSSQGVMYVLNGEGYIQLYTQRERREQMDDNYFRYLYKEGNKEVSNSLEKNIAGNKSGFFEAEIDGVKYFAAYTPIEEVHDWYLITSVPIDAISANANLVIKIFYVILLVVILIFLIFLLYFSRLKQNQKTAVEKIAFVDTITEGSTYIKFIQDVQSVLTKYPVTNFYILKFDIDNFKFVNNNNGFDYGDRLLRYVEKMVKNSLSEKELIARIYGDNFVALLEDARKERLSEILKPESMDGELTVLLSAGIYEIKDRLEGINLMVDKAGTAARTVKGSLRNKIKYYSSQFDEDIKRNEQMKRDIQKALQQGELIPYYQPKVNVNSGEIVGAEALVRWVKEDGKIIPPNDFIPMCEETGLIVELDMHIFEQALEFQKKILAQKKNGIPISVNFSRRHLGNADFCEKIMEKLQEHQVPPDLMEIELTESSIFDNMDIIYNFTQMLRRQKLKIAMDDFGSGYSSLNMLKDIPIDVLKVDREFLSKASDRKRRDIIFESVVRMARRLDISVVVEGVEDIEDVELMKACGCSTAQGYYYSKPVPEKLFLKMLEEG